MEIEIDEEGIIPVYEQIVLQIQAGVLDGHLVSKMPLPSIRQLADDLNLNHNTVAKAYQFLERQGVIESHGRRGSFISSQSKENIQVDRSRRAGINLYKMFEGLRDAGFSEVEVRSIIDRELSRVYGEEL